MKKKEFYFSSHGKKLYGVWEYPSKPRKPLILFLHGLTNSHTNCPLISETTELLHVKGFPTFRFDYYGSGNSQGMFRDKSWEILVQNH